MNVDKLNKLRSKVDGTGSSNASLYKVKEGKQRIRIIPNKFERETNFINVDFHYGVGNRGIACGKNFGEECPICDLVQELFSTGDDNDTAVAKKIMAKSRYFTPIVVRQGSDGDGKFDGPFWLGVSNTSLKSIIDNYDGFGDFTNMETGNDFNMLYIKKLPFPETTITITKSSELISGEAGEKLVESVPDLMEYYNKWALSPEEMDKVVSKFVGGEAAAEEEEEEDEEVVTKNKDLKSKINKLMDDEDE